MFTKQVWPKPGTRKHHWVWASKQVLRCPECLREIRHQYDSEWTQIQEMLTLGAMTCPGRKGTDGED